MFSPQEPMEVAVTWVQVHCSIHLANVSRDSNLVAPKPQKDCFQGRIKGRAGSLSGKDVVICALASKTTLSLVVVELSLVTPAQWWN